MNYFRPSFLGEQIKFLNYSLRINYLYRICMQSMKKKNEIIGVHFYRYLVI